MRAFAFRGCASSLLFSIVHCWTCCASWRTVCLWLDWSLNNHGRVQNRHQECQNFNDIGSRNEKGIWEPKQGGLDTQRCIRNRQTSCSTDEHEMDFSNPDLFRVAEATSVACSWAAQNETDAQSEWIAANGDESFLTTNHLVCLKPQCAVLLQRVGH